MKGYKAFEKGLVCRGKQYAENAVFEEESAELCKSGMHFCENPLDTLDYYPLIDNNGYMTEFAEVEALDEVKTEGNKSVTRKLKIGAKLSLGKFIEASVEFMHESIKKAATNTRTKHTDELIRTGGSYSKLAGGSYSKLAGGYNSQLAGGDNSQLAGGDNSQLAGGYNSQLAGGYNSQLAGGKHAVMIGDDGSIAQGKKGALIVLVSRKWQEDEYVITDFKAEIVDGKRIKEDTPYKLVNGEFAEIK